MEYLDLFVAWKTEDAAAMITDLLAMAAALERSKIAKCGGDDTVDLGPECAQG